MSGNCCLLCWLRRLLLFDVFFLEILQGRLNILNGLASLAGIFTKEISLTTTPYFNGFARIARHGSCDSHVDGIPVGLIGLNAATRKDSLDAFCCCAEFLIAPVSVTALCIALYIIVRHILCERVRKRGR